jgi:hypothetical protein
LFKYIHLFWVLPILVSFLAQKRRENTTICGVKGIFFTKRRRIKAIFQKSAKFANQSKELIRFQLKTIKNLKWQRKILR